MQNETSISHQISLFRSRIQKRSFDDGTIRILESVLVSKEVESLVEIRSALNMFVKEETLLIIREFTEESFETKLRCVDFLVRVFALIGDAESCLALRYEALVLRQQKAATHPMLRVSSKEWLTFAEHSLENGFYSIADKACEKAFICSEGNHVGDPEADDFSQDEHTIAKIKKLKDAALFTISSYSVQSQVSAYLKRKKVEHTTEFSTSGETQSLGSSRFRSGIRKHNLRRLLDYRRLS